MNFKQFITENNSVARNNALKKQQELVDAGKKKIEVTKLPAGVYQLTAARLKKKWFCTPDGRVEEHELDTTQLLTNAQHAYFYAIDVLNAPFPEGEKVIATDLISAFHYARDVLQGPFPAGEQAIATSAYHAYYYAMYFLKAPFPAGEQALATNPEYAFQYVCDVLKGPFPAGEKVIMRSEYKARYKTFLRSLKK